MKKIKLYWLKLLEFQPWAVAVGVVLSSSWVADALREGFELWARGKPVAISYFAISYIVVFAIMLFWLYRVRQAFFRPYTRYLSDIDYPEKREYLVLFLSELDTKREDLNEGIPNWLKLSEDLDKDISELERIKKEKSYMWRWEMPLRAIRYHRGKLKAATLICSHNSVKQAHWFCNIVNRYRRLADFSLEILVNESGKGELIECPSKEENHEGWDFERFDSLSDAMHNLLKNYKEHNVKEKEIMVDFTGGQKVTSVVAAAVTFNRKLAAQYVQTNDPWNVVSYDILLGSPDTPSMGV